MFIQVFPMQLSCLKCFQTLIYVDLKWPSITTIFNRDLVLTKRNGPIYLPSTKVKQDVLQLLWYILECSLPYQNPCDIQGWTFLIRGRAVWRLIHVHIRLGFEAVSDISCSILILFKHMTTKNTCDGEIQCFFYCCLFNKCGLNVPLPLSSLPCTPFLSLLFYNIHEEVDGWLNLKFIPILGWKN